METQKHRKAGERAARATDRGTTGLFLPDPPPLLCLRASIMGDIFCVTWTSYVLYLARLSS